MKRLIFLFIIIVSCEDNEITLKKKNPTSNQPDVSSHFTSKVISTHDHDVSGSNFPYQLIKLERENVRDAYIQYIPLNEKGPMVVITDPYSGIDWSGDAIDLKWAARPNATIGYLYDDEEAIGYDSATSEQIAYILAPHANKASDVASIYLNNGIGVAIVYGRFYTGSTIKDLTDDMVSAFHFLASKGDEVDLDNIGVLGNSLGGFMAAHGAARASEAGINVKAGTLHSPALDFEDFFNFHLQFIPSLGSASATQAHEEFVNPHEKRILPVTGDKYPWEAGSSYGPYKSSFLSANLSGDYLIFHDEWDTMTPFDTSKDFVDNNSNISGFWYHHSVSPDYVNLILEHAPPDSSLANNLSLDQASLSIFTQVYLIHKLQGDPTSLKLLLYDKTTFLNFFANVKALQDSGKDVQWIIPRLIELANSNFVLVNFFDVNDILTGDFFVSEIVNLLWGQSTTAATIRNHLINNGL